MHQSLLVRDRSTIGTHVKECARQVMSTLLGADAYRLCFGANATTLLEMLARQLEDSHFISEGDEIVICSENHVANVHPWLAVAKRVGATVKWWTAAAATTLQTTKESSLLLESLLTHRTKIVALSHASNTLGQVRPIKELVAKHIRTKAASHVQVVVDGVGAIPHVYANVKDLGVDWYVVSCHKVFGPHLGVICGRNDDSMSAITGGGGERCSLERGTINYEACAGIVGLGTYFQSLSTFDGGNIKKTLLHHEQPHCQSSCQSIPDCRESICGSSNSNNNNAPLLACRQVEEAYRRICRVEQELLHYLLEKLRSSTKVTIIGDKTSLPTLVQLPIICFQHASIPSTTIVEACASTTACRQGTFLSMPCLLRQQLGIEGNVVRFSLAHYNTMQEIDSTMDQLVKLEDWF